MLIRMRPLARSAFLLAVVLPMHAPAQNSPAQLHDWAHSYYEWKARNDPVSASDQGLHTWDDRLKDYSQTAVNERRRYVQDLLERVRALDTTAWSKDDQIDAILFRAQL